MDASGEAPRTRKRRAPQERLPDTPDPVEIAMVVAASGKPIPHVARRVLEEQAELIHAQRTELRLKHVGNIVRAALWALLAIVALALVAILGTAMYRAARANALVVESFRVPPAMAAQGLTGEVVATQILDKVAEFQSQTESVRAASSYDNNWGDDLKIDIPNTGATAEQVWKLLRGWLGEETRISGEVVQTADGIALTSRVGAEAARRFTGDSRSLDQLVTRAAEHILRETQPYRYSVYSARVAGNLADRVAVLQELTRHPSAVERKWAFNGLAMVASDAANPRARIAWARKALAIDPDMYPAWTNIAFAELDLGHEQESADILQRSADFEPTGEYDAGIISANKCLNQGIWGSLTKDPAAISSAASCTEAAAGTSSDWAPYYRALAALLRHDLAGPLRFTQAANSTSPAVWAENITADVRLRAQMDRPPSPVLAAALEKYRASISQLLQSPDFVQFTRLTLPTSTWPLEAEALILLGRVGEAAALIERTPTDCYACVRVRGMASQAQGNLPEAQRWYVKAVRQAPRLAPAYVDWARLLIRARRPGTAIPKLSRAAELAPRWADPMKYWGDALVAEGKPSEALAKYNAALKLAPHWIELQQAKARLSLGT